MKLTQMFPSNYLKKEDVATPITATIQSVTMDAIKGEHGEESKPVVHFQGNIKPMVLNVGNGHVIAELYGDDTDKWTGKAIEIYCDPNVQFAGKRIGGIRLRAPTAMSGHTNGAVWLYPQMMAEASKVGLTLNDVKEAIRKAGHNSYLPARDTVLIQQLIATKANEEMGFDDGDPANEQQPVEEIPF
jgi:hypothetical protein